MFLKTHFWKCFGQLWYFCSNDFFSWFLTLSSSTLKVPSASISSLWSSQVAVASWLDQQNQYVEPVPSKLGVKTGTNVKVPAKPLCKVYMYSAHLSCYKGVHAFVYIYIYTYLHLCVYYTPHPRTYTRMTQKAAKLRNAGNLRDKH